MEYTIEQELNFERIVKSLLIDKIAYHNGRSFQIVKVGDKKKCVVVSMDGTFKVLEKYSELRPYC